MKTKLSAAAVALAADEETNLQRIYGLWDDVCSGDIELDTEDFSNVYGRIDYTDTGKASQYIISVDDGSLADYLKMATESGGYRRYVATSTVSGREAARLVQAKVNADTTLKRDNGSEYEHFEEGGGAYTCKVWVSVQMFGLHG